MVFLRYNKTKRAGEVLWREQWLSRDEFDVARRRLSEQAIASAQRAYDADPEGVRAARHAYYEANKEHGRVRARDWQRRNREKCLKWIAAWRVKAIKRDPSIKLAHNARVRLYMALKGGQKAANTFALVGVKDRVEYKAYIGRLFQPGMTWENYGDWEIDHIIPCRYFRPMEDPQVQRVCFHHSNLQPMWKADNVRKHRKVSAACFDRVCAICPPSHVPFLRDLQQKLDTAGKLEKSPYSSPTHVPAV